MGTGANVAPAEAAEVRLLSANAVKSVVTDLADAFRRETGYSVRLTFGTAGEVQKRLAAGEATDVVITTDTAMEKMVGEGLITPESRIIVARVGIGVGLREGAPKPDISSTDAFKQTLLAAKSVAHGDPARGGAAAIHFARVIERLGISQAIKAKEVIGGGLALCELVAKGEAELCVTQISEMLPVKGVTVVGPLPRDLQNITTFAAGVSTRSTAAEAARAFVSFLARPSFRAKFAEAGLDFR